MKCSWEIGERILSFAETQAAIRKMSLNDYCQKYLLCGGNYVRMAGRGEKTASLSLCDKVIDQGCDASWLFLGKAQNNGDPVKCFSLCSGNKCRILSVKECEGYDKCKFYKSEAEYMSKR